ncbi:putative anti-sigma regulatory factor, serine/threonine protein kinase [Geobacter metallireducens RCH3]|uniref:Anti-sigma factor, protein serine/threonine kinase n=1 Tax=Geobacter metallireducens (strain ATCC 53774 / DSM 7210 / GS-15) TaxID=269799 RepID=Q39WA9_GEOMG|nr:MULTISPECIES: ATP-binding protein [Geobacter]ABB31465.1 anti-sigma factor, protein serine/threonine kinase [Geobacter metallireducens GS-15]EHP88448.1 putative anti-sigma regulatory factor, serine/threonine protein kinase [Geobacter metallireducens RCH3]MBT1076842.1 ATP-binding protein [Geobacter grbiciae]
MDRKEIEVDIKVPNQTRYLSLIGRIGEDIAKELDRYDGDRDMLAYHINLVLTEAMVNAIKHANANDPDKMVHVYINITDQDLLIRVFDDGQGFNINSIPPPDFDQLEDRGRGIFIIKQLMDTVKYEKINGGNMLEMTKCLRCCP